MPCAVGIGAGLDLIVGEGPGITRCGGAAPPGAGEGGPGVGGRVPLGRVGFSLVAECEDPSR